MALLCSDVWRWSTNTLAAPHARIYWNRALSEVRTDLRILTAFEGLPKPFASAFPMQLFQVINRSAFLALLSSPSYAHAQASQNADGQELSPYKFVPSPCIGTSQLTVR